ncbi:hypothetical protein B0H16DRAFT_1734276 [Mycena metata]|uniref:CxC2-like cysteine cluster KDZ transposase-associated domain-containing protein n=1 Tax=Mycena metata TaxID=1033252 RepID=A0AAD7HVS8_9AGAR|nr:hypothetical protein B0H16DRAFT_1734276 [Mycena metata]
MKAVGVRRTKARAPAPAVAHVPTSVPTFQATVYAGGTRTSKSRYVPNADLPPAVLLEEPPPQEVPLPFLERLDEAPGAIPAYETMEPSPEAAKKIRQTVAHMQELRDNEQGFLHLLLSLHHQAQLLAMCACGSRCWVNKHRNMPTHWAFVWNRNEGFFEKHDFCRVMKSAAIGLGHYGQQCPVADLGQSFTLVDTNGIHATSITFCRCASPNHTRGLPEFEQLMAAGIFPGSMTSPKTGYTMGLLQYHRQQRSQGKGSAYNFVLVLQRMADPFFASAVPDIYANFLAITRFYESLQITIESGQAHGLNIPLPGETGLPYPHRPKEYLGAICAACPEPGVNMPLVVNVPKYLRHTTSHHLTFDGNYKANLFFKRDDGSDTALTDGKMYFPNQAEFNHIAETYVIPEEDKEVPCKAHIGAIRHQGHVKYGNTAISGVVACACDHAVLGSLVDMPKGEAFAIVTTAQRELLRHINSPPREPESQGPVTFSYDSWCSFVVNLVKRAVELFPEEEWLHALLQSAEGQIPADHINGHGPSCQATWQAVYFACRGHFHGETAEMIWAFLNPLGSSTRQMTGGARHDIINFVMHAWNMLKYLRQAERLGAERLDALRLFELHMAVVEDLSRQHSTEVGAWSRMSRLTTKSKSGKPQSVYQHELTDVLSVEVVLATMITAEQERLKSQNEHDTGTPVAQWIHDGMSVEHEQVLAIALLQNHREHPLQETWESIIQMRDSLNLKLKKFRERQREIHPHLTLSALDVDEPELTAIQLPSYRMRHGHHPVTNLDRQLQDAEIKLRFRKARELDYRGQAGITRSQRNLQKAELMKEFEISMYNNARAALIHLGYMAKDAVEPYRPLTTRDTRRKETHLHRAKGDSRLFDGTTWYLQSGVIISEAAFSSARPPVAGSQGSEDEELQLLSGTKTLKRSGFKHGHDLDLPHSKSLSQQKKVKKAKKADGWIWLQGLTRAQSMNGDKLAAYRSESERVQWFRAEAEMYRWLEQYERKHAEFMRIIERYHRDSVVWAGLASAEETRNGGLNGAVTFAWMQAAMHRRLEHNANVIFKSADSGAHHDWVSVSSFEDLINKIDGWRDVVFKWMDNMGIHRAYKDF